MNCRKKGPTCVHFDYPIIACPCDGLDRNYPTVPTPRRPVYPYQEPQRFPMPSADKSSMDYHAICREEIDRLRRKLRKERFVNELPRSRSCPGRKVSWAAENCMDYDDGYVACEPTVARHKNTVAMQPSEWAGLKTLRKENKELRRQLEQVSRSAGQSSINPYASGGTAPSIQRLSDQAIMSLPTDFWRKFAIQAQELLSENRRLFQELHHLKCTHGGSSISSSPPTAPANPAPVVRQYDSLPNLQSTVSHAECDRRNSELEEEIDRLKRERSKLRMQGDSIQEVARAISQKQAAIKQEISQYQALERENATQRELLMKLANERDSMVQVLKERDRSFSGLLGSIKQGSTLTRRNTCDLIAKERELEALIGRLVGMSENLPPSPCENDRLYPRANENANGVPYRSEYRTPYPVN